MKHMLLGGLLALAPAFAAAQDSSVLRPVARSETAKQLKVELPPLKLASVTVSEKAVPEEKAPATTAENRFETDLRPPARSGNVPRTRWTHMDGNVLWTRSALSALKDHGQPLVDLVPRDIANWCPAYPENSDEQRRAFWVGFMSALAKHESTYRPWAVGGGGKWYGLLQILPGTARGYKCRVGTGAALKNGPANLSCAIRIMAHTVPRDGVIHGYKGRKGQGVTADWGPMHSAPKRRDMAGWLKRQTYCTTLNRVRPRLRPAALTD